MQQVKELRISFICPTNGTMSFGTKLDSIKNGKVQVACQACGGQHLIEPTEPAVDNETTPEKLIGKIEYAFIEIIETAGEIEDEANNVLGSAMKAKGFLKQLQEDLAGKK